MKRSNCPSDFKWNFSHLYESHKIWQEDLQSCLKIAQQIKDLEGKLNQLPEFKLCFQLQKKLFFKIDRLGQYIRALDLDVTNEQMVRLQGLFEVTIFKIQKQLTFIDIEIKKIGQQQINKFMQDPDLQVYQYAMRQLFKMEKHFLPLDQEELLSRVARSRTSISLMYDTLAYADKKAVYVNYKNKKQLLTPALYTDIMQNSDPHYEQLFRIRINRLFNKHIVDKKHSFAKLYEGNIIRHTEEVNIRNYKNSLTAALIADDVDESVYHSLIKYARLHSNVVKRYIDLKRQYLKLDLFYRTDNSLKLGAKDSTKYTVNQSKHLIQEAFTVLGPIYQKYLDIAWSPHKVDYYPDTNKRDGAYSSGGTSTDPIILMNWDDSIRSVATLAHEIGHSVHTLMAKNSQPYPLYEYPILLAEVASTLNEHLLFDYMLANTKKREFKIDLLQNRIDDLIGTFYRQIQFAEFELTIHELVEKGIPLTAKMLADTFDKISCEYAQNAFDKKTPQQRSYGWPRILHFFHSPFYVYKYATSVVASLKLYQDLQQGNTKTVLDFLQAGGHKEPLHILRDFGVDFKDKSLYENFVNYLDKLINKLEEILKSEKV